MNIHETMLSHYTIGFNCNINDDEYYYYYYTYCYHYDYYTTTTKELRPGLSESKEQCSLSHAMTLRRKASKLSVDTVLSNVSNNGRIIQPN